MARFRKRPEPRPPPPTLPATIVEAEENIIQAEVKACRRSLEDRITGAGSHHFIEAFFLRQLELHAQGSSVIDPSSIVEMAEGGHPPADHAVRHFIDRQMEADRFQQMPVSVRNYARRSQRSAPLPIEYPSRVPQIVSNFTRDLAIYLLVEVVVARWPEMPPHHSTRRRRSAAHYVGTAFMISEDQAARIHKQGSEGINRRLAEFMVGYAITR